MYTQLYFHPIRGIYDIHLREFLKSWLAGAFFSTDLAEHLAMTDNEVTAAMLDASRTPSHPGYAHARAMVEREHFRRMYQRNPDACGNQSQGRRGDFSGCLLPLFVYGGIL